MVVLGAMFVFRCMGRDYEVAVMSGGFIGFMLGTTANAMAVMRALVERYGPAPRAFLVAPLVGAFFIDFINAPDRSRWASTCSSEQATADRASRRQRVLPEHTLPAYALAILQGADYIEPDLVATRMACWWRGMRTRSARPPMWRHIRSSRRDAACRTSTAWRSDGWFTEDFTLAELKTLRARERYSGAAAGQARHDGKFEHRHLRRDPGVPGVRQHVRDGARGWLPVGDLSRDQASLAFRAHRTGAGTAAAGRAAARAGRGAPVFIQSFEVGNLQALRGQCDYPLVQLLEPGTQPELASIARYAQAIGVHKSTVVSPETGESTGLAARAHEAGLALHAWALRAENRFLGARWQRGSDPAAHGDLAGEITALVAAGADGLFCDHPAEAMRALGVALATGRMQD